ncbi:MAG: hypothetical protein R2783_08130 [Gelidibacter sp.]
MYKIIVSSFFLMLFTALISAPTIIHMVDDATDISIFYSLSEEEEKGHPTIKNIEIIPFDFNLADLLFASELNSNTTGYNYKTYPKPHLNLISPPPEPFIL